MNKILLLASVLLFTHKAMAMYLIDYDDKEENPQNQKYSPYKDRRIRIHKMDYLSDKTKKEAVEVYKTSKKPAKVVISGKDMLLLGTDSYTDYAVDLMKQGISSGCTSSDLTIYDITTEQDITNVKKAVRNIYTELIGPKRMLLKLWCSGNMVSELFLQELQSNYNPGIMIFQLKKEWKENINQMGYKAWNILEMKK